MSGRFFVCPIQAYLDELHRKYAALDEGAVATYIPELAKANPDWFSICMTTADGKTYQAGDAGQRFTIQSISKALIFGLALEDNGWKDVMKKVGVEPSGDSFNAIIFDENHNRPFNPMVNAGAIATTALVRAASPEERNNRVLDYIGRFAGRSLTVDEDVYRSEQETGHRNRAIAHLMRNFNMLENNVDAALDAYFRQCSILVDCRDLSVIAATLANGGVNPLTGERVLSAFHVRCVLSVTGACGMYNFAGEWAYRVGMPAKSGVSGGILSVLPGQLGLGVFSPLIDARGNTVRGIEVCQDIVEKFGLHQYDAAPNARAIIRNEQRGDSVSSRRVRPLYERDYLEREGCRILVLELQGHIFFGATESLLRGLEARLEGVSHLILDFNRVNGITPSAASLMANLKHDLQQNGVSLLIACADEAIAAVINEVLLDAETADSGLPVDSFDDVDAALEFAEQQLLSSGFSGLRPGNHYALREMNIFRGLTGEEISCLERHITTISYEAGETIFREGDPAQVFFTLASGSVSVVRRLSDGGRSVRLASIGPGVAFGEMALLDPGSRSADVRADTRSLCYMLSMQKLEEISKEYPQIQLKILRNMAQEMSVRLRRANQEFVGLLT
ncbi:MAG: glutaminase A [Alphaproteobacteria bacterium]